MLFKDIVELDSGLLIPSAAAAGKLLASDSSGNATWQNTTVVSTFEGTPGTTPARVIGTAYNPSAVHPAYVYVCAVNQTADGTACQLGFFSGGQFMGIWQSLKSNDICMVTLFVAANGTYEVTQSTGSATIVTIVEQVISLG